MTKLLNPIFKFETEQQLIELFAGLTGIGLKMGSWNSPASIIKEYKGANALFFTLTELYPKFDYMRHIGLYKNTVKINSAKQFVEYARKLQKQKERAEVIPLY